MGFFDQIIQRYAGQPVPAKGTLLSGGTIANLFQKIAGPGPTPAFFQTRISRTPGQVDPRLPSDVSGLYEPSKLPAYEANKFPETRGMWVGQPLGMISVQPGQETNQEGTLTHESLHDIFQKGGLHGKEMTRLDPYLSPGVMDIIKSIPVYQREAAQQAPGILSEEGAAMQLGNYGKKTPELQGAIRGMLSRAPEQQKQFDRLMGVTEPLSEILPLPDSNKLSPIISSMPSRRLMK